MSLHQRIIALIHARPELALLLWAAAEPEIVPLLERGWIVEIRGADLRVRTFSRRDRHCLGDLVLTLHPKDNTYGSPKIVLVVECQLNPDPDKLYTWVEYLAAARRQYRAIGRVLVLSTVARILEWARNLFTDEPELCPVLIGREHVPLIDDHGRALRDPALAVLSAVFHGAHEHGAEVVSAAAIALLGLPKHERQEYMMLLEDALPEEKMEQIRKVTLEEAQQAADEWFRSRWSYRVGHREGREEGLLLARRDALVLVLELRGLTPSAAERARIDGCEDRETIERWCERAKTAASVAALFEADA